MKLRSYIFWMLLSAASSSIITLAINNLLIKTSKHRERDYWAAQQVNYQRLNQYLQSDRFQSRLLSAFPTDFITAARTSTPAVLYIQAISDPDEDLLPLPNGLSTGSGVLISPDGYIVTNNHVVEKAEKIKVTLNDNREFEAQCIGTDPTTDLALLKIESNGLPFLLFGNSDSAHVGEWVLAVGNPFGLQSTVTAGIISAKARNINILNSQQYRIESFIQTDAAVNPGNSGGALVNTAGELIGINTAIMTHSGRYEGYSFSIPSNLVRKVINDLKEFGTVQRGLLGVVIENIDNEKANFYGLKQVAGVLITSTTKNGSADDAGLKPNDVILEINGRKVNSVPELQEIIGRYRPGSKLEITYWRNNTLLKTSAVLKNQINSTELIASRRDPIFTKLGFEVRDLSDAEKKLLPQEGIKVISILSNSKIARTNMAPNYIITAINGKRIKTVDQLKNELSSAKGKVLLDGYYEKYRGKFPYSFYMD